MPRTIERRAPGWLGLLGVLATSLGALGCPGTLDPALIGSASGAGGSGATGGGGGTGGATTCDVTAIFNQPAGVGCATSGCHDATLLGAGLNLTLDSGVGSRLVGVMSTGTNGSMCGSIGTPYLEVGSNPAAGLLIDKITLPMGSAGLCPGGEPMPYPGITRLTAAQQTCVEEWAEGLIMAAGAQ
jgi:hypothetical protein